MRILSLFKLFFHGNIECLRNLRMNNDKIFLIHIILQTKNAQKCQSNATLTRVSLLKFLKVLVIQID